ncbi:GH-E family nuclease [Emticicia sp. TH156]|uniref:GH-E family nuclease n=1 Tax=Emticicia sp. TH156 TaxID=2067454 RepID=UPI000C773053|nr:GH-E family nuclease [Emticicia sp. TH156]PLK42147.1 hypothetical protein C0V77_22445 [Emticicia sp. TH156]
MRRISFGARTYNASIGKFDGVDVLAEKYFAWSPYHFTYNNPLDNIDPDGRSIWTKVAKAVVKVGKVVAKEGVVSLKKGATWADAVSDIVDNGKTVLDDKASTGDRVIAGLSLLSEALPLSIGDVKDVYKGGKKLLGAVDGAKDITKRPSSFRKKTVVDNWNRASNGSKPNTKKCPTCDKDVEGNPNNGERRDGKDGWDVSHNPSWSKRKMPPGATRNDALDEYNRGTELECRSCNRSRGNKDEKNPRNQNP